MSLTLDPEIAAALRAYAVMRTVHALESLAFRPMSALTCQREAGPVHLFPESTDGR
jgi:hypothetical protein